MFKKTDKTRRIVEMNNGEFVFETIDYGHYATSWFPESTHRTEKAARKALLAHREKEWLKQTKRVIWVELCQECGK